MQITPVLSGTKIMANPSSDVQFGTQDGKQHLHVQVGTGSVSHRYNAVEDIGLWPNGTTITVSLVHSASNATAPHPLVPGQSYVLTVGAAPPVTPPPVVPPPVTPPSTQVFTCKYSRLMNFVGEVTAPTQADADARYKEYVDKTFFTAKPI